MNEQKDILMEEPGIKPGFVTITLVLINFIVFVWLSLAGSPSDSAFMLEHGAVFPELITERGEWYRLFTACFLHFDFEHLVNNMLMLAAVGQYVEHHMGRVRYTLLYLCSGVLGNVISVAWSVHEEHYFVSAGASGAVFGLMGALLGLSIRNGGPIDGLKRSRILLMICLAVFAGATNSGVDNVAHVGGLVSGFLIALLAAPGKIIPPYSG